MITWFADEKAKIDHSYKYEIEIYRSQSVTIINEMKLEIDLNLETVINEYRVTIQGKMDAMLLTITTEWDAWKIMITE